jgi:UTP--glucose-1-phosphate uridylyltransferase
VVGRYLLSGTIFERLQRVGRGAGGEIQLTDGIAALLGDEPVYAYRFKGKRYDCGSKLGYLEATVEYGLRHPELGERFAQYIQELAASRRPRA